MACTRLGRLAAVGTVVSAIALVSVVVQHTRATYLDIPALVVAAVALVAAAKLWRDGGVEARIAVAGAALTAGIGALLASVIGMPGSSPRPLDVPALTLLSLGLLVPLLVVTDRAHRRPTSRRPYAH